MLKSFSVKYKVESIVVTKTKLTEYTLPCDRDKKRACLDTAEENHATQSECKAKIFLSNNNFQEILSIY